MKTSVIETHFDVGPLKANGVMQLKASPFDSSRLEIAVKDEATGAAAFITVDIENLKNISKVINEFVNNYDTVAE